MLYKNRFMTTVTVKTKFSGRRRGCTEVGNRASQACSDGGRTRLSRKRSSRKPALLDRGVPYTYSRDVQCGSEVGRKGLTAPKKSTFISLHGNIPVTFLF